MWLPLLLACAPGSLPLTDKGAVDSGGPAPVDSRPADSGRLDSGPLDSAPLDSAPAGEAAEDLGAAPTPPDGCSSLYAPGVVQVFEVEIAESDWAALESDYARGTKSYHPITLHYGEEAVAAHIRLKGNPSFSWFVNKMQFVISVNEDDPDARFHGQRKIALDAAWYEPTTLRDQMAWQAIRRHGGLPDTCVSHAALYVNGDYYGLYANIEYLDHEWLERNYGDALATGTLWKYGSEPVANAEVADSGPIATMFSARSVEEAAVAGDPAQWTLAWAAEVATGDDDGYWCCDHNYYLYDHPTAGIQFVPWDLDDAFDVQDYNVDPLDGYGSWLFHQPLFDLVVNDPAYASTFIEQVDTMADALDPAVVIPEMEAELALVEPYIEADPNRSWGYTEHAEAVNRMELWLEARSEFLHSWAACQRGESADADGDGHTVCTDPNDADASVHPGAPEACNGVDDDADGWIDDDPSCEDCTRRGVDGRTFLFCRWPRTQAEAAAHCDEEGGALSGPVRSGDSTVFTFYTWPVTEHWWTGGAAGGGRCQTWDESSWWTGSAPCGEAHPSVCLLDVATP